MLHNSASSWFGKLITSLEGLFGLLQPGLIDRFNRFDDFRTSSFKEVSNPALYKIFQLLFDGCQRIDFFFVKRPCSQYPTDPGASFPGRQPDQ